MNKPDKDLKINIWWSGNPSEDPGFAYNQDKGDIYALLNLQVMLEYARDIVDSRIDDMRHEANSK